jgi:hypothetical protein
MNESSSLQFYSSQKEEVLWMGKIMNLDAPLRRNDIQLDDTQHNDSRHYSIIKNATLSITTFGITPLKKCDTQHDETQRNDIHNNGIIKNAALSITELSATV